jgi:hypothetical protein
MTLSTATLTLMTQSIMSTIATLSISHTWHNVMLSVVLLSVVMLSVVMLRVFY